MSQIKKLYQQEVNQRLQSEFKIKNPMAVPMLEKIVINVGLGEALTNRKVIGEVSKQLAVISGQKPAVRKAKKSVAGFKLREGKIIGLKVTLRGEKMYDFFCKLTRIVLPRMRDFQGVSEEKFDGQGNITLGFEEQIVFPEIEYGKIDKVRGLEVTIVTTAKDDKRAKRLLELLGMPFRKKG